MRARSTRIVVSLALAGLLLAGLGFGVYRLMNSRTYQAFGRLVARVETEEKVVALTFDDAPSPQVPAVLEILEQRQTPATFFAIGQDLAQYPDLARRIVAGGHQLGDHSYSHRRMIFKTPGFISREIEATDQLIAAAGYTGPIYFRPPYSKKLVLLPWYLSRHNITTVTCDVEPDSNAGAVSPMARAAFLAQYTLEHVRPGSIILLHPLCDADCAADRAALPAIIDGLRSQGYRFVTVAELLRRAAQPQFQN